MKSSVIIKGNKYGFQIVLNPTLPFEELLREVGNKFKESTHFFDLNKPIAVSFTGRELTSGEQNLLVDTISENSGLNISCVIDGAKVYETQFAKVLNEIREEEKKEKKQQEAESFPENRIAKNGQFYRGRGRVVPRPGLVRPPHRPAGGRFRLSCLETYPARRSAPQRLRC